MTNKQLNDELIIAGASIKAQKALDQSASILLHAAAVLALDAWVRSINACSKEVADDAICKEMAAAYTALNGMVDRSAALLGDNK
jgi:hypothetical protein